LAVRERSFKEVDFKIERGCDIDRDVALEPQELTVGVNLMT
jgi:hypothetical protein